MLKQAYSKFLQSDPRRLHFAAHSHHPWPDISEAAHAKAWTDAATLADLKWEKVFGRLAPQLAREILTELHAPEGYGVAFAPNTHELVFRLLSCVLVRDRMLTVLTTDSEFQSFERQLRRLEEAGWVRAERVALKPYATFEGRFQEAAHAVQPDVAYLSQVSYLQGFCPRAIDWSCARSDTLWIVDGYHGFCAIPFSMPQKHHVFYTAGGYKYAQSGEGVCFMVGPDRKDLRPIQTGWFAGYSELSKGLSAITQYDSGLPILWRLMGSTFDPSGMYRMSRVLPWLRGEVGLQEVHAHVRTLQTAFLERFGNTFGELAVPDVERTGHFLAFQNSKAREWVERLAARGVVTDSRGAILRFGFGSYQDLGDIEELARRL